MGYMAIYKRESFAKGVEQGVEQGIERGQAVTLRKQLQLKFRDLDAAVLERLDNASEAELELWTERILFADTVEAVFQQ